MGKNKPPQKSVEELIAVRKGKAARVRERGDNPFANDVLDGELPLTPLAEVRGAFADIRDENGKYPADEVEAKLDDGFTLVDVRAPERYRGEVEPYDPPGGRIAGARNVPLSENLDDGRFKTAEALRAQYQAFLGDVPPERLVVSCGSGITACHTLLALERAGLGGGALYVGSYSEWSRTRGAIGTGDAP